MEIDPNFIAIRWDVIIVGSGAGGAAAALGLEGRRVLMLDVGLTPPANPLPDEPMYSIREQRSDLHGTLLGEAFESLGPIGGEEISPKLKAPLMRYLSARPTGFPVDRENGFHAVQSFAQGGLANAWGAGLLRYNDSELKGFPISSSDLNPLYDELTDHIGINGSSGDDLTEYLGSTIIFSPRSRFLLWCPDFWEDTKRRKPLYMHEVSA